MKLLLTAVNAKYIHSNPAIYCLQSYAHDYREHIELAEYTINQSLEEVLRSIYEKHPDILAFSCYIWNISMIERLIREYKKLDPNVEIWLGGPEVSYDAMDCLESIPQLRGVMVGEGEATFLEVVKYYVDNSSEHEKYTRSKSLSEIRGICYRDTEGVLHRNGLREALDFRRLPFLYQEAKDLKPFHNHIIYYETSRGRPFSCSYCLSSIEKGVRFRDLDLVYQELQLFLDHKVPQIKFIDRTFNCNKAHAMGIINYIKEHDNQITNFHFEIAADLLGEEELNLLSTLRPGLVQLEIGVQSTNPKTIEAIHRVMDLKKVAYCVDRVKQSHNIHQHLDLIVGLPYEDYISFANSFNDVYAMYPDQLQLGFLKVLKGSLMGELCKQYEIYYHEEAPYEVLYTKWLPYEDVCRLKDIEDMVEVYYNSGQFSKTIRFLEHKFANPFAMYEALADYYRNNDLFGVNQARIRRYTILREFAMECLDEHEVKALEEIMVYDLYLREKLKSRPEFASGYEMYKKLYKAFLSNHSQEYQIGDCVHIEHFVIDIEHAVSTGEVVDKDYFILFDYSKSKNLYNEHPIRRINPMELGANS
jgi:radical SAM superfamily enzyme YgiQ (UPF0313 family)